MRAGGRVDVAAFRIPSTPAVTTPDDYDAFIVDDEPVSGARLSTSMPGGASTIPGPTLLMLVRGGAAAHAGTRAGGAVDFAGTTGLAVAVKPERYLATDANTMAADARSGTGTSAAEAHDVNAATPAGQPREVALAHEAA